MTEPSQYFKGRTVQEQMNEVIGYVDTRAAEVATTAIASDVAQVHQDMLDADADASAAAASAAAAAGTLANAVKKTGEASQSIAGDIAVAGTLSGGVVTGTQVTVPAPVNNTDAANKKYVDDADALKLNINDVNSYAVGLTGNQDFSGVKTGATAQIITQNSRPHAPVNTNNKTFAVAKMGVSSRPHHITFLISGRYGSALCKVELRTGGVVQQKEVLKLGTFGPDVGFCEIDGMMHLTVSSNVNEVPMLQIFMCESQTYYQTVECESIEIDTQQVTVTSIGVWA